MLIWRFSSFHVVLLCSFVSFFYFYITIFSSVFYFIELTLPEADIALIEPGNEWLEDYLWHGLQIRGDLDPFQGGYFVFARAPPRDWINIVNVFGGLGLGWNQGASQDLMMDVVGNVFMRCSFC